MRNEPHFNPLIKKVKMEIVDKQVMKIFDTEWREFNRNVFTQVEDLWDEEGVGDLDDEQFERYVLSYFQNVTNQLKSSGISSYDMSKFDSIFPPMSLFKGFFNQ